MYEYRYLVTVLQLPPDADGSLRYVAFGDDRPIKVPPDDAWEFDNPGERPPEDPAPFTIFTNPTKAMSAAEDWAYGMWIEEPGVVIGDGYPGSHEPDDPHGVPCAFDVMSEIVGR